MSLYPKIWAITVFPDSIDVCVTRITLHQITLYAYSNPCSKTESMPSRIWPLLPIVSFSRPERDLSRSLVFWSTSRRRMQNQKRLEERFGFEVLYCRKKASICSKSLSNQFKVSNNQKHTFVPPKPSFLMNICPFQILADGRIFSSSELIIWCLLALRCYGRLLLLTKSSSWRNLTKYLEWARKNALLICKSYTLTCDFSCNKFETLAILCNIKH